MSDETYPYLIVGAYLLGVVITHMVCFYVIIRNRPYILDNPKYTFSDLMNRIKIETGEPWTFSQFAAWTWPLLPLWLALFGFVYCMEYLYNFITPRLLKAIRSHFKK